MPPVVYGVQLAAESLAMLLRPGNAGSNTVTDHIQVLADAIAQLPVAYRWTILVRVDGAGATHDLLEHLHQMNKLWRTVKFTVGWTITEVDEAAIAVLPAHAWTDGLAQDGAATDQAQVAELTGLNERLDEVAANWARVEVQRRRLDASGMVLTTATGRGATRAENQGRGDRRWSCRYPVDLTNAPFSSAKGEERGQMLGSENGNSGIQRSH